MSCLPEDMLVQSCNLGVMHIYASFEAFVHHARVAGPPMTICSVVFELKQTFDQIVSGAPNICRYSASEIAGDHGWFCRQKLSVDFDASYIIFVAYNPACYRWPLVLRHP